MNRIELLKSKSIVFSFRAPLGDAMRIVEHAQQRGVSVSKLTYELWKKQVIEGDNGNESNRSK